MKAFVLGAGIGFRLRPLTDNRPKPLVPVYGKPLITFAFDHLIASGVSSFVVNAHHCPEAYPKILGSGPYRGCPLAFRHEPVLLDTGGGIKNVEDLIGDEPFIVYNGDVLADFPLRSVIDRHATSGNLATLVLRSSGGPLHIQCRDGRMEDIRGMIGNSSAPSHLFTGITVMSPEMFRHIPTGNPVSIISVYLDLLRAGAPVGGAVIDEGLWFDLGNRESYIDCHARLREAKLSYVPGDWPQTVQEPASVSKSAELSGACSIGRGAKIGDDVSLEDCIVWENAAVEKGARLKRCVVRDGSAASGEATGVDF